MLYEVQLTDCPREEVASISESLEQEQALSITWTDLYDDPIFEPKPGEVPLWPHVVITALFATQELAHNAAHRFLHRSSQLREVAEQDWERTCMLDFKPQHLGKNLWICPSWATVTDPAAIVIQLDPGLAFGTGTHPTTALCLRWLAHASINKKSVVDYGCGSGILSLAALKLGADHVHAIDLDPQALQATQQNALHNHITHQQLTISL